MYGRATIVLSTEYSAITVAITRTYGTSTVLSVLQVVYEYLIIPVRTGSRHSVLVLRTRTSTVLVRTQYLYGVGLLRVLD